MTWHLPHAQEVEAALAREDDVRVRLADAAQARVEQATTNENTGSADDRTDVIRLRYIAALHARVFPHPVDDPLRSV